MDRAYYNTIITVAFSPCGNYFVAGNVFGDLIIFHLDKIVNSSEDLIENGSKIARSKIYLKCSQKICCVTSSDRFLIVGCVNEIIAWNWCDIISLQNENIPKLAWKIEIPSSPERKYSATEVNSLKIASVTDIAGDILFAGCGDNNIYSFSLEDGRILRTYSEHLNYIHSIDVRDNLIVSGSEDGSVRLWDARTSAIVNVIEPHHRIEIARPELGHWIGSVSLNEDWLVCGGGTRLSLWNLRTMDCPMTVFTSTKDRGIYVAQFFQDLIIAGGSAPYFSLLNFNDDLRTGLQSSNSTVYGCALSMPQNSPKALCFVGNSNNIDITTNFRYREYVIPFY